MFLFHNFIKGLFPLCFYLADDGAGGSDGGDGDGDKGGSGDKGGDEGDKGGEKKKYAGKYESLEAYEKAYEELETKLGTITANQEKDKAELENLRAEKAIREKEKNKSVSGKAQKALEDFDKANDPDSLSGADYRRWHTNRTKLVMAVENERADTEKANLKETTSKASKKAIADFLASDGEFLTKNVKDYNEKELKELADWGSERGCATYSEAHYCRENEKLTKENEDLKKEKKDLEKKIEKGERRQTGFRNDEGDGRDKDNKPLVFSNRRQIRRQRISMAARDNNILKSYHAMMEEQKKSA